MSATSRCVSGSWTLENDTTHGQTGSKYYTAADRRAVVSARMSRECYVETAPVEFKLYAADATKTRRLYRVESGLRGRCERTITRLYPASSAAAAAECHTAAGDYRHLCVPACYLSSVVV